MNYRKSVVKGGVDMLSVRINEDEFRRMAKESIDAMLKRTESELVYWDSAELKKRTCMSWDTIQATFFFDPRFPKRKVGGKWYFPARGARTFLESWLQEQPS
jgi:hypothetical protein